MPDTLERMPHSAGVQAVLIHGKEKHGWRWLKDANGCWWGARHGIDYVFQVKPTEGFPARIWQLQDGSYTPRPNPDFAPLNSVRKWLTVETEST